MAVQTVARNESLSTRDQRRLTIAQREIRTLERMLWLLSEYGREDPLSVEGWALGDLVRQSLELIEPELSERRIAPRLESSPDLPRVRADAVRLRPVLGQLLLNVAASLPEGGPLEARLAPSARGAQLRLVDAAAFLTPGEEERIFEPCGSRLARGAGLSLAALRRVLQQQDGEVTAGPGPGHGIALHPRLPPGRPRARWRPPPRRRRRLAARVAHPPLRGGGEGRQPRFTVVTPPPLLPGWSEPRSAPPRWWCWT
jgi:signal transduction histidine kinase